MCESEKDLKLMPLADQVTDFQMLVSSKHCEKFLRIAMYTCAMALFLSFFQLDSDPATNLPTTEAGVVRVRYFLFGILSQCLHTTGSMAPIIGSTKLRF